MDTYSELLTELDAFLNRSDLTARIPTFIKLFESRVSRILRTPEMEEEYTFAIAAGVNTYALPSDFLGARAVYYDDEELLAVSPAVSRSNYDPDEGIPVAYSIVGTDMVLVPTPNASDTVTLIYLQKVPALTEDAPTNWLLSKYPDLYLYGTLTIASAHIRDDEATRMWKSAWDEALREAIKAGNQQRLPASPIAARPTVPE